MSVETVPVPRVLPPIDPCPFCGDKGPEIEHDEPNLVYPDTEWWVECGNCQARGPRARVGCRDDEEEELDLELEAITMWNGAIARAEASEEE